jgi:hypothetical protein
MNKHRKVSVEVERQLVELYLTQGKEAAMAACVAHGVNPRYAINAATSFGKGRPRWRGGKSGGTTYKSAPPTITRSENDPRWAWAIERGPVLAP